MSRAKGKSLRTLARAYAGGPDPKALARAAKWQAPYPHRQAKAAPKPLPQSRKQQ